jgi:hypothetical protein
MRPLRGQLLLEGWERGMSQPDLTRPLALLAAASDNASEEDFADLGVADRDIELLRLRRMTFGDALRGCAPCGGCGMRLEFTISTGSMMEHLESARPIGALTFSHNGIGFSMRPVTTRDLAAISGVANPRRCLLALCMNKDGTEPAMATCEEAAVENFNRLNESAEIRFNLTCPGCGHADEVDLDLGRFVWAEVRHAAMTTLRDVHDLASAFGWSEESILTMGAIRRAMYLEMART